LDRHSSTTNEASINLKDDAKIKEPIIKWNTYDVLEALELLGAGSTISINEF